eukprot:4420727-Amphidinium_carterae.1
MQWPFLVRGLSCMLHVILLTALDQSSGLGDSGIHDGLSFSGSPSTKVRNQPPSKAIRAITVGYNKILRASKVRIVSRVNNEEVPYVNIEFNRKPIVFLTKHCSITFHQNLESVCS